MQAMRPVFTELLDSVQRSLEYYKTASSLDTVIGVGSTFRIPGLRRFLGTQLQKDVIRLDEPRKIRVEGPEAAAFATNTVNLWTAYGLALQEIGVLEGDKERLQAQLTDDIALRQALQPRIQALEEFVALFMSPPASPG